jgi:hypothetical protein
LTVDNETADYYCLLPIAVSDYLNSFSLNTFSLAVPYCLQQLTVDNETADYYCLLPIAVSDYLNSFSLNTFSLAVPYCLQQLIQLSQGINCLI